MTTSDSQRVALITGGTTGIGLATAALLHEHGYAVIVTGKNPATIASARESLPEGVTVVRADLRDLGDAGRVADEVREQHGVLDALFLNAGTGPMQPIHAVDETTFDDIFATNVKGQFFTLQAVLPLLRDGASVVLMSALGVQIGAPAYAVATSSRGAMLALVAPLAVELAPRKIRVNAVLPGAIDTPAFGKLGLDEATAAGFNQWITQRVLAGRYGTANEVAHAVAFLLSPEATFINGAHLKIDGGMGVS